MTRIKISINSFWIKNHTLILWLTLPLLIGTVVAFWFSQPLTLKEICLNLATDFITIVITIWYVDWILKRQEELRWKNAEKYISSEAGVIGHSIISTITEAIGLSKHVLPKNDPPWHKRTIQDIQAEIISKVKDIDRDQIITKLKKLDAMEYARLMEKIKHETSAIALVISQFGSRLSPEKLEALLNLREAINAGASAYETVRIFLGVPNTALPSVKGKKDIEMKAIATVRIGIDLELILRASLEVIETFAFIVEPPKFNYDEAGRKSLDRYWDR